MQTKTITVPFTMTYRDDDHGFAYVNDDTMSISCYAPSAAAAASKMRPQIIEKIREALEDVKSSRWIIGTKAGDVFVVEHSLGAWGYRIAGPDRLGVSSCWGPDTFEEARDRARKHVEQAFNGIAWEHSL